MLRRISVIALGVAATAFSLLNAQPALAHGFSSTVYADITAGDEGHVRTKLELEYDLFLVSAADTQRDDPLFRSGTPAFEAGDTNGMAAALNAHADNAVRYVTERFTIDACTATRAGDFTMTEREGVPYTVLNLDWNCPGDNHEIRAELFPDSEGYIKDVKTIVTYDLGGASGSAALDRNHTEFSIGQTWYERFGEFFLLGAEHLLFGIDHILFVLALIAGSRRLKEIVLAATSFTVAHSVTFVLAALGLVDVPAKVVEPVIALSIAVVAAWGLWKRNEESTGWGRLAVVFGFGLVHGLGFAGALGIDEAWSWTLLWSLVVFNVGIEVVQLSIIAVVCPLLMLLRRRAPRAGRRATVAISAGVSVMGLVWFVQRLVGA
ncbi:HupE/UreJ family protein [Symbioplanes lichenis]|uniref:HupE/UreJ family protein n=1 Tax=Symbioplanes lichenis TaxID=1629072 RepID=UPI0027392FDD|nr:HupE/UreJ family protein [Actinoplanes lichenis]